MLGIAAFCVMLLQTLAVALSAFAQVLPRVIFSGETSAHLVGISLTLRLCEVLVVASAVVIAFALLGTTVVEKAARQG